MAKQPIPFHEWCEKQDKRPPTQEEWDKGEGYSVELPDRTVSVKIINTIDAEYIYHSFVTNQNPEETTQLEFYLTSEAVMSLMVIYAKLFNIELVEK